MLRQGIRAVWIAAALVFACSVLASCGGEDEEPPPPDLSADRMLDRAFEQLPESGRAVIDLDASLPQDRSERVAADLEGPFADEGGPLPSFDLEGEAEAAGFGVDISLVSTGDDAYVVFFGENYRVGSDRVAALGQQAGGLEPRAWFAPAEHVGSEEVEGTDTYRIEAPVDTERVRADLERLGLAAVDSSGLEGGTVEAWVGVDDGAIHRLRLISEAAGLDLVLSELGEPKEIRPPPGGGFQPIEDLLDRIPEI